MQDGSTGVLVHSYSSVIPSVHLRMLMLLGSSLKRGWIFTEFIWNDTLFRLQGIFFISGADFRHLNVCQN